MAYQLVLSFTGFRTRIWERSTQTDNEFAHPERYETYLVVNQARNYGYLIKKPCEQCGNPNSQAHHVDYDQPLLIQWLCPSHHRHADYSRRFKERQSKEATS